MNVPDKSLLKAQIKNQLKAANVAVINLHWICNSSSRTCLAFL